MNNFDDENNPYVKVCQKITAAIQEYLNVHAEDTGMPAESLQVAVVAYEAVSIAPDGTIQRRTDYTIPTDDFSASTAIGCLEVAKATLVRNVTLPRLVAGDE